MPQELKANAYESDGFTVRMHRDQRGVSMTVFRDDEIVIAEHGTGRNWLPGDATYVDIAEVIAQAKVIVQSRSDELAAKCGITSKIDRKTFSDALCGARLNASRINRALARFDDGESARECFDGAIKDERAARKMWVDCSLRPWCERHGITIEQGLSVAFRDQPFNPQNPEKDLPTIQDVMAWNGQQNDFALTLMTELKMNCSTHPQVMADGPSASETADEEGMGPSAQRPSGG